MKVKLVKSKNKESWYSERNQNLLGNTFQVHFSEMASKDLDRNVYEIITGEYKGRFINVSDTQILVSI